MGRPRKTAKHHKATGNYRPSRHGTLNLPVEIPPQPGDLSPAATATWNIVTEQLLAAGLVSLIDLHALRLLCESMDLYLQAADEIRNYGVTVDHEMADGRIKRVVNPAVRVRSDAWRQVVILLKQFGMAPAARSGIRVGDAGEDDDDKTRIAKILNLEAVS